MVSISNTAAHRLIAARAAIRAALSNIRAVQETPVESVLP